MPKDRKRRANTNTLGKALEAALVRGDDPSAIAAQATTNVEDAAEAIDEIMAKLERPQQNIVAHRVCNKYT